jgi:hypothetical protein
MRYPQIGEGPNWEYNGQKQTSEKGPEMIDDLDYIDLPDKRLSTRLGRLVEQLSAAPESSIPVACGAWPDTKAAYRFF